MKQMSLGNTGFELSNKRTRKREFLDEMNLVVPWGELVALIAPHAPAPGAKGGRDLLGFFEPIIPVRRPGWEWIDCAA